MHQKTYATKVVKRFLPDCDGVSAKSPMSACLNLHDDSHLNSAPYSGGDYRAAVGSLLYLSGGTRPDLAHSVHMISQHSHEPRVKHWDAVIRILHYLNGSTTLGLCLGGHIC